MADVAARPPAAETGGTRASQERVRTPAQLFSIVVGPVLVLVGILGFVADSSFDVGSNDTNNLVHIASGVLLVVCAKRRSTARVATLGFGVVYALITVIGVAGGNDVLGFIPVSAADNVLHAVLSIGSLVAGFISTGDDRRRKPVVGTQRGAETNDRSGLGMATDMTEAYDWRGRTAVDRDGDKVGKLERIYLDQESGEPEWALVNTGLFGMRSAFVPLAGASPSGERVSLNWDKSTIEDAPSIEPDGDLSHEEEAQLYDHYGFAYASSR